jgi:hypothetical protein
MASLRLFLAIAAAMDLELCQLDIDTAYLYAPIEENVYIRQPLGFSDGTPKVCHPKRCLYGLKQSPPQVEHTLVRHACRERVLALHLEPVHMYFPHRDSFCHNCTLRG